MLKYLEKRNSDGCFKFDGSPGRVQFNNHRNFSIQLSATGDRDLD